MNVYNLYVKCTCTCTCMCTIYMCKVCVKYIYNVCVHECMYNVCVHYICTIFVYNIYVQCVCAKYVYSICVQCMCTSPKFFNHQIDYCAIYLIFK